MQLQKYIERMLYLEQALAAEGVYTCLLGNISFLNTGTKTPSLHTDIRRLKNKSESPYFN